MKYIGNILRSFGVEWREVYPRIDGKKCRGYKVSLKSIAKTEYQAILNAIAIKYEKYSDSVWLKPQWDLSQGETPPQEKSPLTQTEKGIEPATLHPLNVYNQEGQSVAHEELADLEFKKGDKVVSSIAGVEAVVYAVNKTGGTITVELPSGELEKWFDYLVLPVKVNKLAVDNTSVLVEENKKKPESKFILDLLKDLETRSDRFKTTTQIEELLSLEFEQRIIAVEKEILSACPDFYSRWMTALVELQETLPEAIDTDFLVEEHFARIYDNFDAIAEIAQMLSQVENSDQLMALTFREFYSRDRFNKAARLLPKNKQQQLRAIAIELDRGLDSVACSYLERCQRVVGKTVKALVNNAGDIVSKLGKFIGLEFIDNRAMVRVMIDGISHYYKAEEFTFL